MKEEKKNQKGKTFSLGETDGLQLAVFEDVAKWFHIFVLNEQKKTRANLNVNEEPARSMLYAKGSGASGIQLFRRYPSSVKMKGIYFSRPNFVSSKLHGRDNYGDYRVPSNRV